MVNQIQHGDVLIKRVGELPKGVKRVERRGDRIIVAEGEATGHAHTIAEKGASLFILGEQMYLEVAAPVTITHPEHKTLPIPEGIYEIGRVKEYDYFGEMERQVRD